MSATTPPSRPHRSAAEVHSEGLSALVKTLGVADTARFLQQYGPGLGDYTAERDALLGELSLEEVLALAEAHNRPEGGTSQ
ncbi:MAG: hypothetical protein AAF170_06355 [Bacteroidota bacterium]